MAVAKKYIPLSFSDFLDRIDPNDSSAGIEALCEFVFSATVPEAYEDIDWEEARRLYLTTTMMNNFLLGKLLRLLANEPDALVRIAGAKALSKWMERH